MSDKKLTSKRNKINFDQVDQDGDNHIMTSIDNALSDDAFALTDEEKIAIIQEDFKNIMLTLGLDLNDDSLSGTPYRVAKMYVKEMFSGLGSHNKPKISLFDK